MVEDETEVVETEPEEEEEDPEVGEAVGEAVGKAPSLIVRN